VSNKNFECVKFLVEHGADPTLKDRWGNTAYDDAMKEDSQEIIQLLSSKSINHH
jgi:ankyrin repeat protein